MIDALDASATGGNPAAVIGAAMASIAQNMDALYAAGARHFVVGYVADFGLTPAMRIADSQSPVPRTWRRGTDEHLPRGDTASAANSGTTQ